jgi:anti-sigma-K factor RskA
MNGTDTKSSPRPCGEDVAAYALGALDSAEAKAFRAHLETCAVCRDELAAFQQAVDMLPISATRHRSPRLLRRRVLDAVRREPKLELRGERRRRARPLLARLSTPRPALALATAVAVVAIAVGAIALGTSPSTTTRVYAAQVTGPGSAHLILTGSHAELVVRQFAPPPAGKMYEVWTRRPHRAPQPTSALFGVTTSGDADVEVPGDLHGVDQVLVTPEPAGGSRAPTHAPVIQAQLT